MEVAVPYLPSARTLTTDWDQADLAWVCPGGDRTPGGSTAASGAPGSSAGGKRGGVNTAAIVVPLVVLASLLLIAGVVYSNRGYVLDHFPQVCVWEGGVGGVASVDVAYIST
jgi:hypothetical protein